MHNNHSSDRPLGLRLAALVEPAIGLLAYTRRLRCDPHPDLDPDSYDGRLLAKTCARASALVAGLADADDPLIDAVRELVQAVPDGTGFRDPALDQHLGKLAAAVELVLRRDVPAAPKGFATSKRRVAALAARAWIGAEVHGCPRGWLPLLERAATQAGNWLGARRLRQVRTVQIKEKLGTLRWYLHGAPAELATVVGLAERASERACLACGRSGTLTNIDGWWATLCLPHAALARHGPQNIIGRLAYPQSEQDLQGA
jgi:hypothetical protein